MFGGGPRKKLEKRAVAAGIPAQDAAATVVHDVMTRYAESNGAARLVPTLQSLSPEVCLSKFDDLISEVCNAISAKQLAESGEGNHMANAYFNRAYDPLLKMIENYPL